MLPVQRTLFAATAGIVLGAASISQAAVLYVSGESNLQTDSSIFRYTATIGNPTTTTPNGTPAYVATGSGAFAQPDNIGVPAQGFALLSTGNLAGWGSGNLRARHFDGTSGAEIGTFPTAANAALNSASSPGQRDLIANGNFIYLASTSYDEIQRVNLSTGVGSVFTADAGNLSAPSGLAFGPDGNLYVGSEGNARVRTYDGTTGAFIAALGDGLLDNVYDVAFDSLGGLYLSETITGNIQKYDSINNEFDVFVASGSYASLTLAPRGITFGPDGDLYVVDGTNDRVLEFNGLTGAFIGTTVVANSGDIDNPTFLEFAPVVVPEPASLGLLSIGGLLLVQRRRVIR